MNSIIAYTADYPPTPHTPGNKGDIWMMGTPTEDGSTIVKLFVLTDTFQEDAQTVGGSGSLTVTYQWTPVILIDADVDRNPEVIE